MLLSKSDIPCSACSCFLIANVTELNEQAVERRAENLPLVERLIGGDCHFYLVSNAKKDEAALGQVQRHLSNDFVEALREELLANGTDSTLSRLTLHELLVEHFSQAGDIDSASRLMTHVLNPVLACPCIKCPIKIQTSLRAVTIRRTYHFQPIRAVVELH